ncbi:hypothetical protein VIN01S_08500 [Vibrio inusitatus NBRC 102082]|uniref:Uncharacterized protein n=1 Tax=Vibrio inusitatus NBRC 102082 TaxID=1219070 RepID=A0A4Y3HSI3_9VIBR|nr:hypothetical protein [Vibrio inusitatus]GEA50046.1 hypothetical protein VIN01S_08500 [Vibrio inusitatus NBRC 102082]
MRQLSLDVRFATEENGKIPMRPTVKALDCISDYICELIRNDIEYYRATLPDIPIEVLNNLEELKSEIGRGNLQTLYIEDVRKGSIVFHFIESVAPVAAQFSEIMSGWAIGKSLDSLVALAAKNKRKITAEDIGAALKGRLDSILHDLGVFAIVSSDHSADGERLNVRLVIEYRRSEASTLEIKGRGDGSGGRKKDIGILKNITKGQSSN